MFYVRLVTIIAIKIFVSELGKKDHTKIKKVSNKTLKFFYKSIINILFST